MRHALALLLSLILTGCDSPAPDMRADRDTIRIDQRMGATPDPGFARALEPREFRFPRDHGAHPDFATEWWYFTGNLRDRNSQRFGYQLTLFRVGLKPGSAAADSNWRAHQLYMGHLAISDIPNRRHHSSERFSRAAAGLAGAVASPFRVWLGPWSVQGADKDLFPLRLQADTPEFGIGLTLDAGSKPMVLQGDRGLSRKSAEPGNASYYYSYTRLPTRGEIRIGDRHFEVEGDTWFDREWSSSALAAGQAGWDWFALQLDDGRDLMFYRMRDKQGHTQDFSSGIIVNPDGSSIPLALDQVKLQPSRIWRSSEDTDYPLTWRLELPAQQLDLTVAATFEDQEMPLTVRYWEGTVTVTGSHSGVGYLELSGYAR